MQEAARTLAAEVRREFGMLFEVRIGINSGPVVVTVNHQGEVLVDFRVDGIAIHIAKRVESLASPGTILLTRDTLALAEGFVRVTRSGRCRLEASQIRWRCASLRASTPACAFMRWRSAAYRSSSGATTKSRSLIRAATRAKSGHGQVVALVGEAGVGKSRIFLEFARSTRHAGVVHAPGGIGVVRQGDIVSSIDRPSEWILRDPESR